MQTVFVTGANGFVGFYLVQRLLQNGYSVFATGKGPCRLPVVHPQFTYQELDFTRLDETFQMVKAASPHTIVHAGALTKPDECELQKAAAWKVNVTGTENMLQAAAAVGSRFLYISTDFVFKGDKEMYTEADAPSPVNYYGYTKMEAELRVQASKCSWAIARPIMLCVPPMTGKQNILTMVATALREKRTLHLFTDQQRLPTYVPDFAWGLHELISKKAEGIFHFCGQDLLSPFDIGMKVARHLRLDERLIKPVTAETFPQPAARPSKTLFDLTKIKTTLGYQPTSFEEGMRKTFELME